MRIPWRRELVPEDVRAAVALQPGERVLAAAPGGDQAFLVASDRALYVVPAVPGPDESAPGERGPARRIRWDLIDRARWEPPLLLLELRADETAPVRAEQLAVDQTGDLPAVVRDRVTNSILVNSRIDVAGGHARVVARRNTDTNLLQWRIVTSPGVDPQDPLVQQAARRELDDLRSRLGV